MLSDSYGAGASLKTCSGWIDKVSLMDALPPSTWTDEDQAAFEKALADQKAYQLATWDEQCRKIEDLFR